MQSTNFQYQLFYSSEMDKYLNELAEKNKRTEVAKGFEISMKERHSKLMAA